ncbi:MBL fold metallo-hydrolase [Clostridiaceae bacterium M8S5]|nr:MBL fold metallo-hydrolase [Clostridiaceae bacterium M8S5]
MKIIKCKLKQTISYLIPVKDKYLLIDTGYEKHKKLLYKRLRDLDIEVKDIAYILLTHHHDDHAGLVSEIKTCNPSCRIIMHVNAVSRVEKGKNDLDGAKYINKKIATMVKLIKKVSNIWREPFPQYKIASNDIIISKDTKLQDIGIDMVGEILYTPGHTDDSISLLLEDGSCFVGDVASDMLQFLGTKYCVLLLNNLDQYYKSWEKIIKTNAKIIYPGHGKQFLIQKLKDFIYKNKEEQLVELD